MNKPKQKTQSGKGKKKSSSEKPRTQKQSSRKKSTSGSTTNRQSFNDYYPFFENLILLLLDTSGWLSGYKRFLRYELTRRGKSLVGGMVFLCCSMAFIFSTIVFIVIGFFLLLADLIGNQTLAAFLIALVTVVATSLLMRMAFKRFRRVLSPLDQQNGEDDFNDYDDDL